MKKTQIFTVVLAGLMLALFFSTTGLADDLANTNLVDKSQFNLFNPTPRDLMRPINSAEYDNVLDSHTLDAGHVQLESSLFNYYHVTRQLDYFGLTERFREDTFSWAPQLRVGLLNNVEFDVADNYSTRTVNTSYNFILPNHTAHFSDFNDVDMGLTINLWGNDSGTTALAVHPYVAIPTDRGEVVGGVDLPFSISLPAGFYLKLDTEAYVTEDHFVNYGGFYNSASLHEDINSYFDGYWYIDSTVTSESHHEWFGYTGLGLVYKITPDLQLFGGIGMGLDKASYDYDPRFGLVFRL